MNLGDVLSLEKIINNSFEEINFINSSTRGEIYDAVETTLNLLDSGKLRVASRNQLGQWSVHQWLKKAILLAFRLKPTEVITGSSGNTLGWDKISLKFNNWEKNDFEKCNIRVVPGAIVRHAAYVAPNVVLMPSFINLGAYIDEGTMIDTWATIGSCAQIGRNVHISGGVGIGGVLEPLQMEPTIIEDNCFIGARSEVVEGCIVREGSVLGMGVFIGKSTKIINRCTGEVTYNEIPPYSVVVPGIQPSKQSKNESIEPSLYCAVIIKNVDAKTRSKTSINQLLRD
ncbi:2,3,4,5-tetrahydropyridine-2,6-dicarboxylate N-succinyltransferase [Liberibacter crescens]|uniref:2,3,4,5-tetrahydropyridine-2,6-dicarboxylate N-succinyltransferase n=1 Tax=Liberibacter crescens TaxID=1273132 RepID=UPI000762ED8C|nr:2,3,4,5-tetrahydropyridine-2,6-dicarboxylate N-succinyltransferase [Liberibacter crescens]AMC12338.1 2,3,4,5-tetrahydropyridine-2,6-carboxylate N-succinyltransferase [Liberibacter crescens]